MNLIKLTTELGQKAVINFDLVQDLIEMKRGDETIIWIRYARSDKALCVKESLDEITNLANRQLEKIRFKDYK